MAGGKDWVFAGRSLADPSVGEWQDRAACLKLREETSSEGRGHWPGMHAGYPPPSPNPDSIIRYPFETRCGRRGLKPYGFQSDDRVM